MNNFFDSLYSRFVLRDLFAKIIPGSICLFVIALVFIGSPSAVLDRLSLSFWGWILIIGLAWTTGIIIQYIGHRWIGITFEPPPDFQEEFWINVKLPFGDEATNIEKQQLERLVVLKEVFGNNFISLVVSGIILVLGLMINEPFRDWIGDNIGYAVLGLFLYIIILISDYRGYLHFREIEDEFMIWVLYYRVSLDVRNQKNE